MIKILIADDQELIRDSLKIVLDMNADMEVIGVAEDGRKVLDQLNKALPDVKIIILTTFDDDEYVFYALKYGASGYLLKGCSVHELTAAIHTVMSGGSILNQGVITKVVKLFSQMAQANISLQGTQPHRTKYRKFSRARLVQ